jgi:hypothetical protein
VSDLIEKYIAKFDRLCEANISRATEELMIRELAKIQLDGSISIHTKNKQRDDGNQK